MMTRRYAIVITDPISAFLPPNTNMGPGFIWPAHSMITGVWTRGIIAVPFAVSPSFDSNGLRMIGRGEIIIRKNGVDPCASHESFMPNIRPPNPLKQQIQSL
jgi:hypothetical protein